MKKAELIEYIQELETRLQDTESKLAKANYIIKHGNLDKDADSIHNKAKNSIHNKAKSLHGELLLNKVKAFTEVSKIYQKNILKVIFRKDT